MERRAQISNSEFQILNRCLDNAIAGAVSEFARESGGTPAGAEVTNARKSVFEKELRLINTARACVDAIKNGHVGMSGSTGAILDRTLNDLQKLAAGVLEEVCAGEEKANSVDIPIPIS